MNILRVINVDLEIHSSHPLDLICAEFSPTGVTHLYNGKGKRGFFASFEAESKGENPDNLISRICDYISDFSVDASSRVFDIGYEHTQGDVIFQDVISIDTLKKMTSLKASITFTVYPFSPKTPEMESRE